MQAENAIAEHDLKPMKGVCIWRIFQMLST
jgi:hypothetical protein